MLLLLIAMQAGSGRDALGLLTASQGVPADFASAASFAGTTYFLHNEPTPPTGNTASQANLTMTAVAPAATALPNYDTDRDSLTGRLLLRGGIGATETDLARYQNWRGPTAGVLGQTIAGTVTVEIWSAAAGFAAGAPGELHVYLRDVLVLTGTTTEIANASVSMADWSGHRSGWVKRTVSIDVSSQTLLVGHALELKVEAGASTDMLVAYDTAAYRSRVRLP